MPASGLEIELQELINIVNSTIHALILSIIFIMTYYRINQTIKIKSG